VVVLAGISVPRHTGAFHFVSQSFSNDSWWTAGLLMASPMKYLWAAMFAVLFGDDAKFVIGKERLTSAVPKGVGLKVGEAGV